jgi:hypothetical protein
LVNINKPKLYKASNVASQRLEATTKGGKKDLMVVSCQNSILEYKSNDQHKINTIDGFHGTTMESPNNLQPKGSTKQQLQQETNKVFKTII